MKLMSKAVLGLIIAFRIVNALLTQTFYQPDEFWQSLEVAHRIAFGYGYLTWEWSSGLRSIAHPMIFALMYKAIAYLRLDQTKALILVPRLFQGLLAAVADYYTYRLGHRLFGLGKLTLFCSLISWYNFLCAARIFSNSIEMTLTIAALNYWPTSKSSKVTLALLLASGSCILRPANAVVWVFLGVRLLIVTDRPITVILKALFIMASAAAVMVCTDHLFYQRWVFVPYNFLSVNIFESISHHYGINSWHWYLTQGVPMLTGTLMPFSVYGMIDTGPKGKFYADLIAFVLGIYSLLVHKEGRFLYPLLPLLIIFAARGIAKLQSRSQKWGRYAVIGLVATNLPLALYANLIHQRGVMDVVEWTRVEPHVDSVGFLMPCHSTAWQSHIHKNETEMWFLTCEPPLNQDPHTYKDEADIFYEDPSKFLRHMKHKWPSHLIMFESLIPRIESVLESKGYHLHRRFFNSHWHDDPRRRGHVVIYVK